MQTKNASAGFVGFRNHVQNSTAGIDHGCAQNANLGTNVHELRVDHRGWHGCAEIDLPERCCGETIGIKRINAIVHGHYINHVANADSRDAYCAHIEWLSVSLPV